MEHKKAALVFRDGNPFLERLANELEDLVDVYSISKESAVFDCKNSDQQDIAREDLAKSLIEKQYDLAFTDNTCSNSSPCSIYSYDGENITRIAKENIPVYDMLSEKLDWIDCLDKLIVDFKVKGKQPIIWYSKLTAHIELSEELITSLENKSSFDQVKLDELKQSFEQSAIYGKDTPMQNYLATLIGNIYDIPVLTSEIFAMIEYSRIYSKDNKNLPELLKDDFGVDLEKAVILLDHHANNFLSQSYGLNNLNNASICPCCLALNGTTIWEDFSPEEELNKFYERASLYFDEVVEAIKEKLK